MKCDQILLIDHMGSILRVMAAHRTRILCMIDLCYIINYNITAVYDRLSYTQIYNDPEAEG